MLKRIVTMSAVGLIATTNALADPVPYFGAGLGITTNTSSSAATGNMLAPTFNPANFRGVPVDVFAGYGGIINQNFYLAGEVFGTLGTMELDNNNGLKTSYGYGVSIIPGVMINDTTLLYARAGVVRSRFTNANDTRTGSQFGLGLQTSVTQNIDIRGEYDYTSYGSLNNIVGKISSPKSDSVKAAVVYKFD